MHTMLCYLKDFESYFLLLSSPSLPLPSSFLSSLLPPFLIFSPPPPSQGVEKKLPYPSWAQFIGSVVVLTSILSMPIFLILRLIFFESGRKEALQFLRKVVTEGEELVQKVKALPRRVRDSFHSVRMRRRAWNTHTDQESMDSVTVPYSPGTNGVRAGAQQKESEKGSADS